MKKAVCLLVLLAISLSLVACGVNENDDSGFVGTWRTIHELVDEHVRILEVYSDGTYVETTYRNGSAYEAEVGTWTVEDGDLFLKFITHYSDGDTSTGTYHLYYEHGMLTNDETIYAKVS